MNRKTLNIIITLTFAVGVLTMSSFFIFSPDKAFSESERRELEKKPDFTLDNVLSGEFANKFETYSADQFPMREKFRTIKSLFVTSVLHQKDNNKIFLQSGHLSKLDAKENSAMTEHAAERFDFIYDNFIKDKTSNVYLTIIPDKNFVLAKRNRYPTIDYDGFIERFKKRVPYMKYIEIRDLLELEDYYKTDTHWKQEKIIDVANRIANEMRTDISASYTTNLLPYPFYGVYAGQSGLNLPPDELFYITNKTIDNCIVTYYDDFGNAYKGEMYNMEKATGKDPYEMFLSGSAAVVEIENPNAKTDKELVILRDSYSSSLAPLLTEGYRKITLADIRYVKSFALGYFVDFENSDVLFAYSTSLLNNSMSMN